MLRENKDHIVSDNNNVVKKVSRFSMPTVCSRKVSIQQLLFYLIIFFGTYTLIYVGFFPCKTPEPTMVPNTDKKFIQYESSNKTIYYDKNMPIIFIGGMPRSGTTLMRVLLDTHPDVRCGEETRVIPRILGMRSHWERAAMEKLRLREAGITDQVLDDAVTSFILEIIAKHGRAAPRLCNKDPFTLKSSTYLSRLFPSAKFVLMVRDGRAVVHSMIQRKVTISGFDLSDYRGCMRKWNTAVESMFSQCVNLGTWRCLPVYYEQLVLHPEQWLKRILKFLQLPWSDKVLHHEDYITKGNVKLSKTEKSTDQVIKPINLGSLTAWAETVPNDIRQEMPMLAPMLAQLGYDPNGYPPEYGKPDNKVADNTQDISENKEYWDKRRSYIETGRREVINKAKNDLQQQKQGIVKPNMFQYIDEYKVPKPIPPKT